jgi:hypothetical protein
LIDDVAQLKEMKDDALTYIKKKKKLGDISFEIHRSLRMPSMLSLGLPS